MKNVLIGVGVLLSLLAWMILFKNVISSEEVNHYFDSGIVLDDLNVYYNDDPDGSMSCEDARYFSVYNNVVNDEFHTLYVKGVLGDYEIGGRGCSFSSNYYIKTSDINPIYEVPNEYVVKEYILVREYVSFYNISESVVLVALINQDMVVKNYFHESIAEQEAVYESYRYYVREIHDALLKAYQYNGSCPMNYDVTWDSLDPYLKKDVRELFDHEFNGGVVAQLSGNCNVTLYLEAVEGVRCEVPFGIEYYNGLDCD